MDKKTHKTLSLITISVLIASACQTTSNIVTAVSKTPTSSNPVLTATASQIPIPTAVIPPTLEPTPDIETPIFEGFNRVEILPNNFFIAYQPPPGNVYDSLSVTGSGGGEKEECSTTPLVRISPKSISFGIGGPGVLEICHFPLNEDVTLTLTQPNGKIVTTSIYNDYKETQFCLPGTSILESGKYKLEATSSGWAKAELNFIIKPPKDMQLFFPKTYVSVSSDNYFCIGEFNSGEPTAIYFRGLKPNETRQMLLYRESGFFDVSYFTTWTITADENGNVVEYIDEPILDINTSSSHYRIIDFDPNIDFEQSPFYHTGGGGLNFSIVNSQFPTPTPFPTKIFQSTWVQIPHGSFLMGASPDDANAEDVEKPRNFLVLNEYWIQQTEVTNANYAECVEIKKCTEPQSKESNTRPEYYGNLKYNNFPVIYVTYKQAQQYCASINGRLPTEAEWEKATRSIVPNNEIFPWSLNIRKPSEEVANFGNIWQDTVIVGSYEPEPGFFTDNISDMAGNVWEWVEDWYDVYPGGDSQTDKNFGEKFRVIRGGSYASAPEFLRISNRFYKDPNESSDSVGFRCVKDTVP